MKHELRAAIRSILSTQHLAFLGGTLALAASFSCSAQTATLPITCASGTCYQPGPPGQPGQRLEQWVTSGSATEVRNGNTLTINQTSDRAVLNWASFDVSADGRVIFNQPSSTSIALNRIYQDSPSQIFGTVEANGQIYLVNPNGFVFGRTARINAPGILASTLSISESTFASGLLAPELIKAQRAALESDGRASVMRYDPVTQTEVPVIDPATGQPIEIKLVVQEGAEIKSTGSNGRVLLASRTVDNAGNISSPDGQVIIAAGERVYLQASTDASLRGLLVEVDTGGEAWNRLTGDISSARGNVTVAGLAVNQSGRISASTTVSANGSVKLIARDHATFQSNPDFSTTLGAGQNGGRLEIGSTSRIEIAPELGSIETAVDDQEQMASSISMSGREIFLRSGSQIVAPGGNLTVTAASNPSSLASYDPSARIRVESGVQIDLSGSDVSLPMSRNVVAVELRANELRDSPSQRDGALRGQTVYIDARVGTPLADVSGALAAIPKNIAERTSIGGTVSFVSEGDIAVADGARIDVSGGVTTYAEGPIATSQLIGADGHIYDIGDADPNRTYVGIINPVFRRADDRWGFVDLIAAPGIGSIQSSYVAGSDAGRMQFAAPNMVLNGALRADTVIGPYQRRPGQAPLGGQLIIGDPDGGGAQLSTPDYRAPSVTFSQHGATSIAIGDDAALPPQQELLLPTDYLAHGFTRTAIYSNGRIVVPENAPLNLTAGSSLSLTGHQVEVRADINSAGGSISVTSGLTVGTGAQLGRAGVAIGDNVTLDVQGNWTNDALSVFTDPFGLPTSSILADGGSISLITSGDGAELVLGDQVQMLANAGAWMQRDGSLEGGKGGSITIAARGIDNALEIGDGLSVQAFGMLGSSGGSFSLTAPRIEVTSQPSWILTQRLDPLEQVAELEYLGIGTSLFTDFGFRSLSLTASGVIDPNQDTDALRIAAGTNIQSRTNVLLLSDAGARAASARDLTGLATVFSPHESLREAMDLRFAVAPVKDNLPERTGLLNMQAGASIVADAGSSVAFASVGGIEMDGLIRARGGSIDMRVTVPRDGNDEGYLPELGLHVGSNAVLDVSGTVIYDQVGDGLLTGTLYDGGKVNLQANRGFVIAERGALIDVSGTSATIERAVAGSTGLTRDTIGTNAGTLSLIAPEAIAFNGTFRAHAGVGTTGPAMGGELVMRLSRLYGFTAGRTDVQPTFPTNPRVLRVTSADIALGGSAPPSGMAVLSQDLITGSGIDALTLDADGRIEFDDISLSMGRRIVLDSPEILARDGANVSFSAPYLAVGNSQVGRAAVAPTAGTGTFDFRGEFIEAIGAVSLSGAATSTLASTGDLRLREVEQGNARAGHLQASGDLTLRATQIYPATLTSYSLSAVGDHSTLRLESSGTPVSAPLSAGGKLTLNAANIEQSGILRAPFGSIEMNATETLTLGNGSVTSVSGNGALIPFGRVENGDWIYSGASRQVLTGIPERHIGLNAPSIDQDSNATLDLQGGGDLYAYEWQPGTGGSRDALAAGYTVDVDGESEFIAYGRFAILPSQRGQYAPYDPQEQQGYDLQVGDSVYLSGIPGLSPGYYALLPARYALLPGGMLIEPVANTTDLQPGSVSSLADGTPVVAGYRTFGSTGLGGTRYSGFAIRPGSQARELAAYEDSYASSFYTDRATRLELPTPVLPADAGSLSLLATASLDMRGIVNVSAAQGGRSGRVEVAATNLEVVNTVTQGSGSVQIAASVLSGWNAGELWLGATKRGDTIDVVADQVRIADGASVVADEVMLMGNRSVEVAAGARVASTSSTRGATIKPETLDAVTLQLNDDDAGAGMVSVSDRNLYSVLREDGDLDRGVLDAADGSVLATGGALFVNAPDRVNLAGDIQANGAQWQLGASTIHFDNTAHADGLNIDSGLLARVQQAGSLSLISGGAINFAYAFDLGGADRLDAITLRASSLNNLSGGNVNFAATNVVLAGLENSSAAANAGTGTLSIAADTLQLGAIVPGLKAVVDSFGNPTGEVVRVEVKTGDLAVSGFAHTSLTASGDIRGIGESKLRVGGDLDLNAARVTAASGGKTGIETSGNVRIARTGTASSSIDGILGGSLSITAQNIQHEGTLFLPSGLVTLEARANLSVADSGVIDVSGQLVRAADRVVGSSGGTVRLVSGADMTTSAGSRIGADGATDADAGRVSLHSAGAATLAGQLTASSGGNAAVGGAFDLYAGTLTDSAGLIARLRTGGFTETQSVHVRNGDLNLAAGETVTARNIAWTSDLGSVNIDGTMRAPSQIQRSAIRLYGSNVNIGATGVLNADANEGVRFGGDIELGSSTGSLSVASGSQLSAHGNELNGSLRLRAAATSNDIAVTQLAGTISNVDSVVIEAVRTFDMPAVVTSVEYDAIRNDLTTYMASAGSTIRGRLGSGVRVEAGAELRRTGDLELQALDLSSWRFDGSPIAFTARATGSIDVTGNISDGFFGTTLMNDNSATLRFAAGADLTSADPNAVVRGAAGDFSLSTNVISPTAPTTIVRTGTGDIRVSAARNVEFGARTTLYAAGLNGTSAVGLFSFADRGGNVSITAGQSVIGTEISQSAGDWQRRQGASDIVQDTRWATNWSQFAWSVGTFGGGDISILAGADVSNLSAAAADSGAELVRNTVTRFGGGSMSVLAGGNINSNMLYVARGDMNLRADGALGSSRTGVNNAALGTVLMLGDAQAKVVARGDINLESIFNPTAGKQSGLNAFFTYSERSAVDARSNGGDVILNASNSRLASYLDSPGKINTNDSGKALLLLPGSVSLMSLAKDVHLDGEGFAMFPTNGGQLEVFAANDFTAGAAASLTMTDLGAAELPSAVLPSRNTIETLLNPMFLPNASAKTARHSNDARPVMITAGRDIVGQNIALPKAVRMTAGRDIVDTTLRAQNLRTADITSVHAGRDLRYSPSLVTGEMSVGGPGRFDVYTGRNLDLGFSTGLTTTGRLLNAAIESTRGADLNVLVGMGRDMDGAAFVDNIIAASPELREALVRFMQARSGTTQSYTDAATAFKALNPLDQRPLLLDLFYGELVASGREANTDATKGFTRGYGAIDALFPGSREEDPADSVFKGDLTLAFSRIYTLDGGDISLAVPGGLLNVGLANPPASFLNNPRDPSLLGIVAQRAGNVSIFTRDDVLVNQSRVFTMLGGDIAIWSTLGDIDAGRGSKSSLSVPPPRVIVNNAGQVTLDLSGAVAGSGIRTIATDKAVEAGDVDLIAPRGIVNAGDAGIGSAGNLNIAAEQVVGLDNIQVGGVSTGVPAETSGLGASLAAVSAVASSASSASNASADENDESNQAQASLAQTALSWLEVFVIGLGEDNCKTDDMDCLKRQPLN
jgi:filamentous hemagglutinin